MDRRSFLQAGALAAGAAATTGREVLASQPQVAPAPLRSSGGRIKQSVCKWCYGNMTLAALCEAAAGMGIKSVELLSEDEWAVPKQFNMTCAVANGPGGITKGWNRKEHHQELISKSEHLLPMIAVAGVPNMIVFSGNREGLSDAEGLRHCAEGLQRIMPLAQRTGVTVIMELLNSKVDHKDYMCDRTSWGVELVKAVGSDRFKLLYDIYHMQIMEGDVIRTIKQNAPHIAHYHTAGNPGRSNLDDTQELDYRGICKAIVDTGYQGYLGQEFIPRGDAMTALRHAVQLCDV